MDYAEENTARLRHVFKERHNVLTDGIINIGWSVTPSNGGMFVWAKYPFKMDDKEFAFEAIKQIGVIMLPGSVFGSEGVGYLRLALVQEGDVLEKAIQCLQLPWREEKATCPLKYTDKLLQFEIIGGGVKWYGELFY